MHFFLEPPLLVASKPGAVASVDSANKGMGLGSVGQVMVSMIMLSQTRSTCSPVFVG